MRPTRYTTRRGTLIFSLSTWVDDDEWLKRYVDDDDDDASQRNFSDINDDESQDDRNLRRLVDFVHRDRNDVNAATITKKRKLLNGRKSFDDTVREQLVLQRPAEEATPGCSDNFFEEFERARNDATHHRRRRRRR